MTGPQQSRAHIWVWLSLDISLYLFMQLGLFVTAKLLLGLPWERLYGPFLAVASPAAVFLIWVRLLWNWEERGLPPTRLAIAWGLSLSMMFLGLSVAFFYSTVTLQILKLEDAILVFSMQGATATCLGFYIPYKMTLERLAKKIQPQE